MSKIDKLSSSLKESKCFDELEVKIIEAMLVLRQNRKNKSTAIEIANTANLSVTNTYKYLYSLQKKGIVEASKDKNKIFWLTQSANPFPKIFSYIGQDYMRKKKIFSRLKDLYEQMIPISNVVWDNEKVFEHYENNFVDKCIFLFDIAKNEILITIPKFYSDFIFLDAIKRAVERGIKIKIISEEIDAALSGKLKGINIQMRLGKAWPYTIITDDRHGITTDQDGKGVWFLNYNTTYKQRFDDMWDEAEEI
ncbi:MAG: hypothetical protein ISS95_00690 [Candidatus Aenigmarchaeota archaeon]|nr:hypothetical protein [Candidatus Aenigmarchaeota archaeon]